jgi:hypothetical protein
MTTTTLLAAALLAQAPVIAIAPQPGIERVDVAYEELAQGNAEAAIARIRSNRELEAGDPAALINLAAAHARLGRQREAQNLYTAAIATPVRYDLQLASGEWMDSRRAARLGVTRLAEGQALAVR